MVRQITLPVSDRCAATAPPPGRPDGSAISIAGITVVTTGANPAKLKRTNKSVEACAEAGGAGRNDPGETGRAWDGRLLCGAVTQEFVTAGIGSIISGRAPATCRRVFTLASEYSAPPPEGPQRAAAPPLRLSLGLDRAEDEKEGKVSCGAERIIKKIKAGE